MKSNAVTPTAYDLLIPDAYPEIIFVISGAYNKIGIFETSKPLTIRQSCFVGIQSETILACRLDQCYLIGLKLFPWAALRLFGEQLSKATNKNLLIADVNIDWLNQLNQSIHPETNEEEVIQLISNCLKSALDQNPISPTQKKAKSFIKSILGVNGQITVKALAEKHFISVRHFQRLFKKYYGIAPKKFINIIRFKQLYKSTVLKEKIPDDFLDYGYYDQMHFIKDFKKQLGITPSHTQNEEFKKLNYMAKANS
jgi:AraC-like DNA-binding protein